MGLIDSLKKGVIPSSVETVASYESKEIEQLIDDIINGHTVIPANNKRPNVRSTAIGRGLKTKVNANIGTSQAYKDLDNEIKKASCAIESGADTIMDLSTGGNIDLIRRELLKKFDVPLGTVPIYQAAALAIERKGNIVDMTTDDMFDAISMQCEDGVDFITVHCGVVRTVVEMLSKKGRVTDVVSRGGAFLTAWMVHNDMENPLYSEFDRMLEIAKEFDVTLSLGDGLRPGSIADASDHAQIAELVVLGELVKRARDEDVQVMVEGPGHMPMDQIEANIVLEKRICDGAPFYVLGPLVTDVAPGYDEITSAIGGAIAAMCGADFLCYVTPREHLGLPDTEDVVRGVVASRIAAHAADIVKDIPGARDWDRDMSVARKALNWSDQMKLAIHPDKAKDLYDENKTSDDCVCTMCGEFCAMKVVAEYLDSTIIETC